ncbi:MAG: c-type cytochrome [Pedosphaera sp.]|nr:c-type cytochrome [Pedosphaera sp.]
MNRFLAFCSFRSLLVAGSFLLSLHLSAAPALELKTHERIAIVGNSLAERQGLYGDFETLLHARFPQLELVVRNFGRPADEVSIRQRPNDYTKIDDPMKVFGPDTFICFFGFNESFAGQSGIEKFKADYEKFMTEYSEKYGRDGKARFVLVTPIAYEDTGNPLLPDAKTLNANLMRYSNAVADVARKHKLVSVDLFAPTLQLFTKEPGAQYTINGAHINAVGDRAIGEILDRELFGAPNPKILDIAHGWQMRRVVVDKSWIHSQDHRMLNGWYVYGGRRTWDTETFPLEYKKVRAMTAVRDRYIWDMAQGKPVSVEVDDRNTGELVVPKTRFGVPQQNYSEPKELRYVSGDESLKLMQVAPGYDVSLFASEETFPELAKPVQLNFDNKGRLWVSCMPTYPQWRPGDPRPKDRLLIFEDTNGDGKADKCKVFYDKLQCPTGFEFWNGGVLVVSQPRLLFLKDTDGDDKADQVVEMLDGWATDDTHHTMGAFEWSPGGLLHGLEGVSMSTTLETPWGAFRNANTPGAYVVDPRTWRVRHFITPGYGNPWCYVYDFWGQGIAGDGTTAQHHWDTPLSGAQKGQRKGLNPVFNNEGMRPALGSEFLYSRHFPDDVQGQFVYGCVINMNGIPRWEIGDDGAGFKGKRLPNLVNSTDRNFRPGETQIGPDGALWFLDWHNPLIGHMQYSQRDPNRDKVHGRIYRLTAKNRPLLTPVTQFGMPVSDLLNQLKEYEPRTRYRARRELRDRPTQEVVNAAVPWVANLDNADPRMEQHRLEALFVLAGHHAVERTVLQLALVSKSRDARALAVRVLSDEWPYVSKGMELLQPMVADTDARVRTEAVRALSFIETPEAVNLALEVTKQPLDYWIDYTLQHALAALEPVWKPLHQKGGLARDNQAGRDYLAAYVAGNPSVALVKGKLDKLISGEGLSEVDKQRLVGEISNTKGGRPREGRFVFERVCTSCHKVKNFGINFGPELTDVSKRLKREQVIESVLYPNKEVAPQWLTTNVTTKEGEELSGVVGAEDDQSLTLKLGGDQVQKISKDRISKRLTLKVSNMPEGLAAGLSTQEFLDVIEYLGTLK